MINNIFTIPYPPFLEVHSFSIYFLHFPYLTGFKASCILRNFQIVTATFVSCLLFHRQSSYIHTTSDDKNTPGSCLSIIKTSNSIVNTKFQLLKAAMSYFGHSHQVHPFRCFIGNLCVNISIGITTVLYRKN